MNLLAIDTSTELATVAIASHGKIYEEEQQAMRQHAQCLLPMIDQLLKISNLDFKHLDGIVFGRGPGSFTGLRIACSVAKALAYAHDLPVYPVSGLAAIAFEVLQSVHDLPPETQILAMIDARMHQLYWGNFTNGFAVLEQVSNAQDIVLLPDRPIMVAGVGLEPYILQLPPVIRANMVRQLEVFPRAQTMIHLVQSGHFKAVSAAEALPVYVRNQVTQGESRG
ncbi:tRNA (adenosine(37)-N6)-threonylcarbamoyltransferase complex dimerization subunit type 1 TsaB [Legionella nagasakiensis]|uniref:tRNA (adenosine(37)-N6)-threonylcarbamoyltransferase complex dimerization subunit type 1 TsaB n=1 Tax=Legionella nagasakiensis TaxID=535290 RepID=UPI00105552D8|nr:tRNA (adenosine(37)-N6)-threonylcarbamoyltransferase complex dimerization subunit type 1 TsaB [Legionella nagasakiensis]